MIPSQVRTVYPSQSWSLPQVHPTQSSTIMAPVSPAQTLDINIILSMMFPMIMIAMMGKMVASAFTDKQKPKETKPKSTASTTSKA